MSEFSEALAEVSQRLNLFLLCAKCQSWPYFYFSFLSLSLDFSLTPKFMDYVLSFFVAYFKDIFDIQKHV
jgi:hypothetical protein